MAHGRKRRHVDWRALGDTIAHAYLTGKTHSVCGTMQVNYVPKRDFGHPNPEHCRPCEIALAQLW